MELSQLVTTLAQLEKLPDLLGELDRPVLLCTDADTVLVVASLGEKVSGPIGVWLEVSSDYPSSLAARDVATLSWLIELGDVVISASSHAESHADIVRALLSDDEVNFTNDVATITKAYNRPAPPRPVVVWSYDGDVVSRVGTTLHRGSSGPCEVGTLTVFA